MWSAWRTYLDCNVSLRRGEVFVFLILHRVENPDYQVFTQTRWHISLCRVLEGTEPTLLHQLFDELERALLRDQYFAFELPPVGWEHPPRYVHFGIEGPLLETALLLQRNLRLRLVAHLSPATCGGPGRLHLAVPVSGRNVPDAAV